MLRTSTTTIISDLGRCVPASRLRDRAGRGVWRTLPYTAEGFSGTLLFATADAAPGPVRLPLGAEGRCRIRLGLYPSDWNYGVSGIRVRLSGEPSCRTLHACPGHEGLYEAYWKEADLDGQELELFPLPQPNSVSALAYVKLERVKAPAPRPATPLWLAAYIDGHSLRYVSMRNSRAQFTEHLEVFRDTPFRRVYWCTMLGDAQQYKTPENHTDPRHPVYLNAGWRNVDQILRGFDRRGTDVTRMVRDLVKGLGMEFHIYHRAAVVHPEPPLDQELQHSPFVLAHPEWRCRDRDGTPLARLSYAFPQVQDRIIEVYKEQLENDIDGINIPMWRSAPLMLYEKPLVDAFRRLTRRDPRDLPPMNRRWLQFRADAVTDYFRRLNVELNEHNRRLGFGRLALSVGTLASDQANRFYGLDVERWFREGLVDHINPYQASRKAGPAELDARYYAELKKRTGCSLCPEIMSARSWLTPEQHYTTWADKLYGIPADGLCFWDADMRQERSLEWEIMKALAEPRTFHRTAKRLSAEHRKVPLHTVGGMIVDRYPTWWAY